MKFTKRTYRATRNRLVNRMNVIQSELNSPNWKRVHAEWLRYSRFAHLLGDRARREKGIWLRKKIWRL